MTTLSSIRRTIDLEEGVGVQTYTTAAELPTTGLTVGNQAFVASTGRLYISNGSGWYNVALINQAPYWIEQPDGSYTLSTTGLSTVITILASDSDSTAPTYTATADSDFNLIATITTDSEGADGTRFIVTPIDSEGGTAVAGSGTVTFVATDGINQASVVSTFSVTFSTTVENSSYTTFLLQADTSATNSQVDASTNNTSTVGENNSIISSAWGPYHPGGYSAYFDDVSIDLNNTTYVRVPDTSSVLTFGTGDFTIETWIWIDNTNNSSPSFSIYDWVESNTADDIFYVQNSNILWKTGGTARITSSFAGKFNKWTHVAAVRNSGTTTVYVDGTSVGSWSDSTSYSVASYAYIHAYSNLGDIGDGYLSDFRVVKGTAVYTSNFTPATEKLTAISGTSLLLFNGEPYVKDVSGNALDVFVHVPYSPGAAGQSKFRMSRTSPYDNEAPYTVADHSGSVNFAGTNSYLSVDNGEITSSYGSDFTVEFWIYKETSYDGYVFDNRVGGQTPGFYIRTNTGGIDLSMNSVQGVAGIGDDYAIGEWMHTAFTFSGTTGKAFINGKLTNTYTIADTASYNYHSSQNTIGARQYTTRGDESLGQYGGALADFRISKVLRYTTDFTPPTERFVSDSNTMLLTCQNTNNIWTAAVVDPPFIGTGAQTGDTGIYKIGNVTASNTQRKFSTSSAVYFDGTGDYLRFSGTGIATNDVPNNFAFYNKDFTVEWWQYWASNQSNYGTIYDDNYTSASNLLIQTASGENKYIVYMNTTSATFTESSAASTGQWYHYALVRNGSTVTMYRNGTSTGSVTYSGEVGNKNAIKSIGAASYDGANPITESYIQDFRVTKGFARYTSSFTPPTAKFDG